MNTETQDPETQVRFRGSFLEIARRGEPRRVLDLRAAAALDLRPEGGVVLQPGSVEIPAACLLGGADLDPKTDAAAIYQAQEHLVERWMEARST